ncbi:MULTISPECIES: hypothetical protein [Amycolatopsis]|uniref:DNA-binding protein n=2 Tax=Amycolatopsis TaxID=1813 RepID=A0A2N3WFI9_9PSEU|nr:MULTISPECIES: hypothetical protein [Amycolatopsis]MBB2499479.1 hypothetical protein [Amycolatopsis echigonensis]PKV92601.1 hypothetical protein ATK30_3423 [Amycolatopsis niigatensis]TVT17384.1 hypothetical protein FNH06_31650 [Amycolatopsis acidiphila]UIJ59851.1 hypothetical protein LWP59_38730 [Amycolatopsis acidiphila]GHG62812.1 hypothetical protein GCM10017788_18750 [Amycolatopsis acidiphila]
MDTNVVPLGERILRSVLNHVVANGDAAETSYLEAKSTVDIASKPGLVKIAKFLLACANRLPEDAARHFKGYAVLVIGAQQGEAGGVARGAEPHELADRLRPYLGATFPGFEFGRISADGDREVLFVIGLPPEDGQPIYPCHKAYGVPGEDQLADGAIYVRDHSNTRTANAGEIMALTDRARGVPRPPITLDIDLLGSISRVDRVAEILDRLYDLEEQQYLEPPSKEKTSPLPGYVPPGLFGDTVTPTTEDRAARLDAWRQARPTHIEAGRAHLFGVALDGVGVRVVSRDRFVARPEIVLTFHNCEIADFDERDEADLSRLVEPVRGRETSHWSVLDSVASRITPRGYPVDWAQRGANAEVTLTPESLRPNVEWRTEVDDYVLVARDPQATSVRVTWVLTEDSSDLTTQGEMAVPAGPLVDAAELVKTAFLNEH